MNETLVLLPVAVGLLMASIVSVRWMESDRLRRSLVAYELSFPNGTKPEAVSRFLTGMAGMVGSRWSRLFVPRPLVFEVTATPDRIRHHLLIPRDLSGIMDSQLRAALPDVVLREDGQHAVAFPSLACELSLSTHQRPLRADQPEAAAAAMLASLQPLHGNEAITLQTVVSPLGPVPPVQTGRRQVRSVGHLLTEGVTELVHDQDAVRAARAKQDAPLYRAVIRLGVSADGPARSRNLLRRVLAPFHVLNAPGAHFRRRQHLSAWAASRLPRRTTPTAAWPLLLNVRELTAVLALPLGELHLAGLRLGQSRPLAPSADIPSSGKVVGDSVYPGRERPLAVAVPDALRHTWVCGPTGVGKSTLLAGMIGQDIAAGHGVVVIDPKGDLITDVLQRLPEDRVDDVIILDPAEADDRPVGFNSLAGSHHDPELSADDHLGTFHRLWAANWGPRTQDHLHAALLTVAAEPGSTLLDLPTILTNDGFRRRLVGRVTDPVLAAFWAAYEDMSPGERAQAIGPPLNKLRQLTLRPRLRAILGQAEPAFTLQDVLNQRRVLLVSLPTGLIGEEAAALLGSLLMARLSQAVYARAGLPAASRAPAFIYADEFQHVVAMPTDLGNLLAQARGLGVGFILAHQHLGQLPAHLCGRSGNLAFGDHENSRSRSVVAPSFSS